MAKQLSPWAIEGKNHMLMYRPKMAKELQKQGKLDEWAQKVANQAVDEYVKSVENLERENSHFTKRNLGYCLNLCFRVADNPGTDLA